MEKLLNVKNGFYVVIGLTGGAIGNYLGGMDNLLKALLFIMVADYITGLTVAVIFKKSTKTETGAAESKAGFIGIIKKCFVLTIIAVVAQVDTVLGTNGFFRNAALIGFMVNELLSIVENAGLMGINLPPAVTNAIDVLKKKSEENQK
ncbi:phage holin family protein [Clostridium intestinale]|uniref:Phage holin family protein n=1 Tax=Clostridium intestinale TaxID=36845 RepID=A0A7D6ZTM0_9CLOT|nr:phage holin family protein [Clostridium intestinale]QLY82223.1 phage holin family protein [Clostridium intestinale]